METLQALKQMEGTLAMTGDKVSALKGKLEDLLFRAQRISNAQKNNLPNNDTMYGYDLQRFRREIRTFGTEMSGIPVVLGAIERTAAPDDKAAKFANDVMRLCMRLTQNLRALHDLSLLAHQHIRAADLKVEAWYLAQEVEEMVMRGQGLPTVANKIVMACSSPTKAPPPAAPPGTPPKA